MNKDAYSRRRALITLAAAGLIPGIVGGASQAQAETFTINAVADSNTIAASSFGAPEWGDPDNNGCALVDVGRGRVIGSGNRDSANPGRIYIKSEPVANGTYTVAIRCYTGFYSSSVVSNRVVVTVPGAPGFGS